MGTVAGTGQECAVGRDGASWCVEMPGRSVGPSVSTPPPLAGSGLSWLGVIVLCSRVRFVLSCCKVRKWGGGLIKQMVLESSLGVVCQGYLQLLGARTTAV